jgi:hypothetical protein
MIYTDVYLQLVWNTFLSLVDEEDPWGVKSSAWSLLGFPHNPSTLSSSNIEGVMWILYNQSRPTLYSTTAPVGKVIYNSNQNL